MSSECGFTAKELWMNGTISQMRLNWQRMLTALNAYTGVTGKQQGSHRDKLNNKKETLACTTPDVLIMALSGPKRMTLQGIQGKVYSTNPHKLVPLFKCQNTSHFLPIFLLIVAQLKLNLK